MRMQHKTSALPIEQENFKFNPLLLSLSAKYLLMIIWCDINAAALRECFKRFTLKMSGAQVRVTVGIFILKCFSFTIIL